MNILSIQQFYDAIEKTSAHLEEINFGTEAQKLRDALSISTLPGEILGMTRLVLQGIKAAPIPPDLVNEIDSEITYLNSILKYK